MKTLLLLIIFVLTPVGVIAEELEFLAYEKSEFQPAKGEVFKIPFYLPSKATVKIEIFSPDADLLQEITSANSLEKGKHSLSWDGKDRNGKVVPNEAYYPVIYITDQSGKTASFGSHGSGGEVIKDLAVKVTKEKNVIFQLPYPARVLARMGIKGGPMLKALADWEPKNKGKVVLRWDGFDSDRLRDLRSNPKVSFIVAAYRLPDFSIITSGNSSMGYREYREKSGVVNKTTEQQKKPLERDGQRIERHYYFSKDIELSPVVSLGFKDKYPLDKQGNPIINCPCTVQANLNDRDKVQLQESLYEISFFVDDEFVSEQEQGYVPFTWRWTPSGLEKGEHTLTVNVSGLRDEVGVKSLKFAVE